jgi:hypothetical protein
MGYGAPDEDGWRRGRWWFGECGAEEGLDLDERVDL